MIEYRNYRIKIADLFLKSGSDLETGSLWTLDPSKIKFKHGESLDSLKVPYHIGAEDDKIIDKALLSLVALFNARFGQDKTGSTPQVSSTGVQVQINLREKNYKTDLLIEGTPEKKAAKLILRSTPFVDGELVTLWLGKDGAGKKLMDWIRDIFDKVLQEESRSDIDEPTSFLLFLSIINAIRKKKIKLKEVRIQGLSYEKLDIAVSLMLFRAFQISLSTLFDEIKNSGVPYYSEKTELKLMSSTEPLAFMAIPKTVVSASINPYGINEEIYTSIRGMIADIQDAGSVEKLLVVAEKIVAKDKVLYNIMNEYYKITMVRGFILKYLVDFDGHGIEAHKFFYDIVGEDRVLSQVISDTESLKKLTDTVESICRDFSKDSDRIEALSEFREFLKRIKKKKSFIGKTHQLDLEEILFGYYSLMFDARVEKFAGHMRMYMVDKRGELDTNALLHDYQSGRLYRFSTDERPVLSGLSISEEAQLFVDMKDFTRKTLNIKEAAMVDFMQENFYDPILSAAARYSAGSGNFVYEKGIRLNSLPGDAAIFSGGIENIVSLACDIQKVSRQYMDKLVKRLPPVKGGVIIEDVHKKHESIIEVLRNKRVNLQKDLNAGQKEAQLKLVKLDEEERKIEESYRKALEDVIAEEMEAGVFITYGAKAETMVVKPEHGVSESLKVAIGEKINEASRGTDRNTMVRAKVEMKLEAERTKRKRPSLKYPFEVFIERVYSMRFTSEIDVAMDKLFDKTAGVNAQKVAEDIGRGCFSDIKKIVAGDPASSLGMISTTTGIYNMGEALSKEAFNVYMDETKATKYFFKKDLEVPTLHQSIRNDFYFPNENIELWFGVEKKGNVELVEGFANVGEIVFKGFESKKPTIVYEILDTEGSFMRALQAHHFRAWHEEHKSAKSKKEMV